MQIWKMRFIDAYIKTKSCKLCVFSTLIVFELFTLEICHVSLEHRLLFNTFNSFNVNIESFQTIYQTVILYTNISLKASSFWEVLNCETLFSIKGYFNYEEKKVALSQHQFDRIPTTCWVRLLVFLKTWVIVLFSHWRSNQTAKWKQSERYIIIAIIQYQI